MKTFTISTDDNEYSLFTISDECFKNLQLKDESEKYFNAQNSLQMLMAAAFYYLMEEINKDTDKNTK